MIPYVAVTAAGVRVYDGALLCNHQPGRIRA